MIDKLKACWGILTGKINYKQPTVSLEDIIKRLQAIVPDKYVSVQVKITSYNGIEKQYWLYYETYGWLHSETLEGVFKLLQDNFKSKELSKQDEIKIDVT